MEYGELWNHLPTTKNKRMNEPYIILRSKNDLLFFSLHSHIEICSYLIKKCGRIISSRCNNSMNYCVESGLVPAFSANAT